MNESIHKYFKVGTIQWMTHPPKDYELLDSLKTIACDDFFDAIEVTQVKDDALREKAKKILDQSEGLLWRTAKTSWNWTEPK